MQWCSGAVVSMWQASNSRKPKPMGRPQTEAVHGVKMPEIAKRQDVVVVVVAAKV